MRFAMKASLLIGLMMLLLVAARAQETESTEVPGGDQTLVPATLAGQSAQRGLLTEQVSQNSISGGISISQMYTDNTELASSGKTSDLSYNIAPNIALNHFTPRLSYDLGVAAGFSVDRTLSERDQATQ